MLKNLTTLFSNSTAGSTNPNLAKQAQIFLVFSDCKIGFHLDLFIFGTKTTTWTVKNKAVCLCGICLTWLKETRYKGTCSLNSFCSLRSSQKFGRNAYRGFFVNYVTWVLAGRVLHMCVHVHMCRCAFRSHICFYILCFSLQDLSFRISGNTGLASSFREKPRAQGEPESTSKVVSDWDSQMTLWTLHRMPAYQLYFQMCSLQLASLLPSIVFVSRSLVMPLLVLLALATFSTGTKQPLSPRRFPSWNRVRWFLNLSHAKDFFPTLQRSIKTKHLSPN